MLLNHLHADLDAAWHRVRAVPSSTFEARPRTVEYATTGTGRPVLAIHEILGSHVEGVGLARVYWGDDCFAIGPDRKPREPNRRSGIDTCRRGPLWR